MIDMRPTITAKSDQLNADDLIGGPITIKITSVKTGAADQPISLHYEGDNNKPYKPCKTMRRVLVKMWGDDGNNYIGKRLTLYNEPTVKWAGDEVGGIRISHASDISGEQKIVTQVSKGKKAPWIVRPLAADTSTQSTTTKTNEPPHVAKARTIVSVITKFNDEGLMSDYLTKEVALDLESIKTASASTYDFIMEKVKEQEKIIKEAV